MHRQNEKPLTPRRISRIPQPQTSTKTNVITEMKKLRIGPRSLEICSSESSHKSKEEVKVNIHRTATPIKSTKKVPVSNKNLSENSVSSKILTNVKQRGGQPPSTPRKIPNTNLDPAMTPCSYCGRSFMKNRIDVHEDICKKSKTKRRKVFDPVKQRLSGTEAEPYLKRISNTKTGAPNVDIKPKIDWRKKHEEFINSIRAAKQVKEHLAKGGKLSDLPPPPAMDTSDYVKCQYCGRKFNSGVAERHIPICSKVRSNKTAPKRIMKK